MPKICNLLESIDLEAFKNSTLYKNILLRQSLLGKNTLQAVRKLADEYTKRFDKACFTKEQVIKKLQSRGRIVSWNELDLNICLLCKNYTQEWEYEFTFDNNEVKTLPFPMLYEGELNFFDDVRYILRTVSSKMYSKTKIKLDPVLKRGRFEYNFSRCHLCWRTVMGHSDSKKLPLCHIHDLDSFNREYRRRSRMKSRVMDEFHEIKMVTELLKAIYLKYGIKGDDFLQKIALDRHGPLKALTHYLAMSGKNIYWPNVCDALEEPFYLRKMNANEQKIWKEYRMDYEYDTYEQLLLAEAWLRVEATYKHGGKRRAW